MPLKTISTSHTSSSAYSKSVEEESLLKEIRQISNMINVSYVRQKEALGLGHAILMSRDAIGNEPFAVMLGDDIIDATVPCLKQMMDLFEKLQVRSSRRAKFLIQRFTITVSSGACPLDGFNGRVYRVQDVVEKPPASKLRLIWRSSAATF